jgi:hypothetical protein
MADILNILAESKLLAALQRQLQAFVGPDFGPAFKATLTDPRVSVPFFAQWPFGDLAFFIHALATAVFVKKLVKGKQHSWLLHVIIFLFINFAGKTIESLLFALPLGWALSDRAVLISFVSWSVPGPKIDFLRRANVYFFSLHSRWVVNCSPFDIVGRILTYGPAMLLRLIFFFFFFFFLRSHVSHWLLCVCFLLVVAVGCC